ncbi:4-hydroxy-tetrahydrodipicolinate reductase [Brumimicrobium oceani]|uniref:4-hydroxy-tetrahydrodipicolinate reductase n=1 Tax=Brumimicrobium oceani TaxID=2100725 RepID=A0A2U2XF04_9FLAO|nr:4-hydroxy-tetrahydrodipicolinate reductase [Brumimicrobium oceani]PWH86386.1 4-hydroxy-tetrahydrodipicolinate reductase [Brumimicrobium oceani]
MKVVLVGYGKMGKEIEKILISRGHEVVGKATDAQPLNTEMIKEADVAIDFSTPDSVINNIEFLLKENIPSVIGTTGWNKSYEQVKLWVDDQNGALVHASNFSVGVNLFFKLNEQLAQLMAPYKEYSPGITEIHHTEKLDAPSGTAITLAEGIIENYSALSDWYCPESKTENDTESDKKSKNGNNLKINAVREPDVKGTHLIEYKSNIDTLSIQHEAHNRTGFALGAVIAAEWIINKKGIFTMKDVLQLS